MNLILNTLDRITIGAPVSYCSLHVFPLSSPRATGACEYVTIERAAAAGDAAMTELSHLGCEARVRLENRSTAPILLLDGQELTGAKQNRVLNTSVLAPGLQETVLPVSCAEASRWEPQSEEFDVASQLHFLTGRGLRVDQVTRSMIEDGEPVSDQVDVWDAIEHRASRLGVHSPTRAHADLFRCNQARVAHYCAAVKPLRGQCGAAFAIGENLVGLDVFDRRDTFADVLPKLVRSAALDALGQPAAKPPARQAIKRFLDRIAAAKCLAFAGVGGNGENVRLISDCLSGFALAHNGRLVHLSAFHLNACRQFFGESKVAKIDATADY